MGHVVLILSDVKKKKKKKKVEKNLKFGVTVKYYDRSMRIHCCDFK